MNKLHYKLVFVSFVLVCCLGQRGGVLDTLVQSQNGRQAAGAAVGLADYLRPSNSQVHLGL